MKQKAPPLLFAFFVLALMLAILAFHLNEEGVVQLAPITLAIFKSVVSLIAAAVIFTGIWSFLSDHWPVVRLTDAFLSEKKNIIHFRFDNYSKSVLKNVMINFAMFEIKIEDGKRSAWNETGKCIYSLKGDRGICIGPATHEEIVINLNKMVPGLPPNEAFSIDLYKDHLFFLSVTKCPIPFFPFISLKQRDALYYDSQYGKWLVTTTTHVDEVTEIFEEIFSLIEAGKHDELGNKFKNKKDK